MRKISLLTTLMLALVINIFTPVLQVQAAEPPFALSNKIMLTIPDYDEELGAIPNESQEYTDSEEYEAYSEVEEVPNYDGMVLKGYAEYRDDEDAIVLMDANSNFALNIQKPQKFGSKSLISNKQHNYTAAYNPYNFEHYTISPLSGKSSAKVNTPLGGGFSFGTTYGSVVDSAQIEQVTSMYTKYEYKRFALSSSYAKTLGTTSGMTFDSFYLTPELKLNSIFTVKEVYKSEITKNRTSLEFVVSVTPLGYKGNDRLNFELGAGQTFDINNQVVKSKLRFSTQYKF